MAKRKSQNEGAPTTIENLVSDLNGLVSTLDRRVFRLEQHQAGFKLDDSQVPPVWINVREQEEKAEEEKQLKAKMGDLEQGQIGFNGWANRPRHAGALFTFDQPTVVVVMLKSGHMARTRVDALTEGVHLELQLNLAQVGKFLASQVQAWWADIETA